MPTSVVVIFYAATEFTSDLDARWPFPIGSYLDCLAEQLKTKAYLEFPYTRQALWQAGTMEGFGGVSLGGYFSHLPINSKSRRFLSRVQTGALSPRFFSALLPVGGWMPQKALKIEKKNILKHSMMFKYHVALNPKEQWNIYRNISPWNKLVLTGLNGLKSQRVYRFVYRYSHPAPLLE